MLKSSHTALVTSAQKKKNNTKEVKKKLGQLSSYIVYIKTIKFLQASKVTLTLFFTNSKLISGTTVCESATTKCTFRTEQHR